MSNERLDEAGVLAKFGVPPERIIDYLTLMGDTVDNVPGVPRSAPRRRPSGSPSTARWTA
jgi:DNA polymerase-1